MIAAVAVGKKSASVAKLLPALDCCAVEPGSKHSSFLPWLWIAHLEVPRFSHSDSSLPAHLPLHQWRLGFSLAPWMQS